MYNHAEISAELDVVRIPGQATLYFWAILALRQETLFILVFASV
jgi:hypothetical protein